MARVTFLRALAALLRQRGFRRLFVSRISSQGSDGIFQVALASHVLFNPEKAADARSIAMAFAVILLPYSLIGPFAGVLLDRWDRRRVLVVVQLGRLVAMLAVAALSARPSVSGGFFAAVLVVFSLNRFILAGLSAALPHVVSRDLLVSANSVAPTCGTLAYLVGGALGTGLATVSSDEVVVLVSCVGVAGASWAAARLPFVGPDDVEAVLGVRHLLGRVAAGFVEAARTLPRRGRLLLTLVLLTRLPFGFFLLQTLLIVRHATTADSQAKAIAVAAAAAAAGFALAAFVTPWLLPKVGAIRYAAGVLAVGALGCATLGPWLTPGSISALGFVVGVSSQGVKITVDSLLQTHVPDHLLGRAFSVYDVMYNAGLVVAAGAGAVLLPASGLAWWPFVVFAGLYLALALGIGPLWQRVSRADETRPLG